MTAIKPATALPWADPVNYGASKFEIQGTSRRLATIDSLSDAAYIVHAANAYPKLVEALRAMLEADSMRTEISGDPATVAASRLETKKQARELLRELGESK